MITPKKISYFEWDRDFKPKTVDPIYPEDLKEGYDANYLWTEVECDEDDKDGFTRCVIVEGFHFVNRLGYYFTEIPHNFEENYEVE